MLDLAVQQTDRNHEDLKSSIEESSKELREIRDDAQAQALSVWENKPIIQRLFWMVRGDAVTPVRAFSTRYPRVGTIGPRDIITESPKNGGAEHAVLMGLYSVSTRQIYTIVSDLRAKMSGIDTRLTFFRVPIKFEDVLGRVSPFPSECSASALYVEIRARFKEGPGKREVEHGDWDIFYAEDPEHLLTTKADSGLLPGISIVMAIVVEQGFDNGDDCPMPRCPSKRFERALGGGRIW